MRRLLTQGVGSINAVPVGAAGRRPARCAPTTVCVDNDDSRDIAWRVGGTVLGSTRIFGERGERAAEAHLRGERYAILERNYACALGEVDLIALDGDAVVFVEVKSRSSGEFGTPFDAVTRRKRRQITRVAQHYLLRNRLTDRAVRFDVVGVWAENGALRCELIRNAFDAVL